MASMLRKRGSMINLVPPDEAILNVRFVTFWYKYDITEPGAKITKSKKFEPHEATIFEN